jgi:uncharacterized damage-inducible protein DinB
VFDRDALRALIDYTDFTWETYEKVAARLPADALMRSVEGSGWPALRDALFHIASAWDGWLRDEIGATGELDEDPSKATSLEYIAACRARTRAWMRRALDAASDEDLQRRDVVAFADGTLATKAEIFAHILLHERGHHGDVSTLLSALGVTPPGIDYTTYVWFKQREAT